MRIEAKDKLSDGTGIWACLTEDKHGAVVSLLNELSTPWLVNIDLKSLGLKAGQSIKLISLLAPDRTTRVTLATQDVIKRVEQELPLGADGTISFQVPSCSVSELGWQ